MNQRVRKLTEGAMMIALIGIALIVNRQLANAFDAYLMWILPFPVMVYVIRYGVSNGVVASVSALAISFLFALPQTVFYTAASCVIGLVYGYGIRHQKSNGWLLGYTIVCSTIVMMVTTLLFAAIFGYDLAEEIRLLTDMAAAMQVSVAATTIRTLVIVSLLLSCVLEGILIHMLAFLFLRRLKIEFPQFKPLGSYRGPRWLAVMTLISLVSYGLLPYFTQNTQTSEILLAIRTICCFMSAMLGYVALLVCLVQSGKRKWMLYLLVTLIGLCLGMHLLYIMNITSTDLVLAPLAAFGYVLVAFGVADALLPIRTWFARRGSK